MIGAAVCSRFYVELAKEETRAQAHGKRVSESQTLRLAIKLTQEPYYHKFAGLDMKLQKGDARTMRLR